MHQLNRPSRQDAQDRPTASPLPGLCQLSPRPSQISEALLARPTTMHSQLCPSAASLPGDELLAVPHTLVEVGQVKLACAGGSAGHAEATAAFDKPISVSRYRLLDHMRPGRAAGRALAGKRPPQEARSGRWALPAALYNRNPRRRSRGAITPPKAAPTCDHTDGAGDGEGLRHNLAGALHGRGCDVYLGSKTVINTPGESRSTFSRGLPHPPPLSYPPARSPKPIVD